MILSHFLTKKGRRIAPSPQIVEKVSIWGICPVYQGGVYAVGVYVRL
jgi:hypothetical protein